MKEGAYRHIAPGKCINDYNSARPETVRVLINEERLMCPLFPTPLLPPRSLSQQASHLRLASRKLSKTCGGATLSDSFDDSDRENEADLIVAAERLVEGYR